MENYTYAKQLPVRYNVDVCVVGGGPAGVAAGVTAARAGAKVIILESQGFFGGAGTAALVPAFFRDAVLTFQRHLRDKLIPRSFHCETGSGFR